MPISILIWVWQGALDSSDNNKIRGWIKCTL